ncbi:MAG: hypothetical protein PVG27_02100 [Chloroflexota bacterium]|jgi:hypothetical protein
MRVLQTGAIGTIILVLIGAWAGVVAAQDVADPMAPAYFTFTLESVTEPGPGDEGGTGGEFGGEQRFVQVDRVRATDPRASGLLTSAVHLELLEAGGVGLVSGAERVRLANDGGTWSGTAQVFQAVAEDGGATVMVTLTGQDGYDGLSLVMVQYYDDAVQTRRGFIIPSDRQPPVPDAVELPAE